MGRQISCDLGYEDEAKFLSFMRSIADIEIYISFANSIETLWINDINNIDKKFTTFHIWNKEFAWKPEYKQTTDTGLYYVCNDDDAPVIEYTRSSYFREGEYGRIYWAKYFLASSGLNYDFAKFTQWYNKVVNWIKKNAAGIGKHGFNTYFLPSAWETYLLKKEIQK